MDAGLPSFQRRSLIHLCFVFISISQSLAALPFQVMGLSGLEPPTSRLSGVRSNRLSYKPISIWQPPAFPYRHQYSIIGRFRLNHRVRDVDGCFPKAHRHQKYPELYCPKQSARFRSASSRCAASPHLRFQTQSLVSKLTVFSFVRYIASHYYHINNSTVNNFYSISLERR